MSTRARSKRSSWRSREARNTRGEAEQRPVNRGALVTVGSFGLDRSEGRTTMLDRLHALGKPAKLAKVVALDVPRGTWSV
jgi:hypothetical protein